ncbi:SPBc2 prophage-derived DNA ligase-like protein LigB [Paenibacillus marchantiophytorum]|uniref:SPBc2 prophage-derived DNA ligase-like protein LigB n=1 Tax=Paenibacillus marchantiophytorum TaxID=1619310 RepID=A0ABQ1ELR2_9BACL|nr:RNA ligase family protein [Paenibacillus marchantiophytorum]GFZ77613.1 SPBc2 prophage-derived DNA ligase-like protein LigB [Paenibacillus marchantiophytorum]
MFISPMLLQEAKDNKAFRSKNYIAELKLDGMRCIVSNMDRLYVYTKQSDLITNKFPELHNCPIPEGTVLDGELVVLDDQGRSDYEAMTARFYARKNKTPVIFYAFDIMRYKGIDVTALPLLKRKELLDQAFVENESYRKVSVHEGNAVDYFEQICREGLEGIVMKSKKDNSRYQTRKRSKQWQKVINWTYADVYISGYRKNEFALLASIDSANGSKIPAGVIEIGVTALHKETLERVKHRLVFKEDQNFAYMEPLLMARIKTRNWTKSGKLRSPVFMEFVV